MFLYQKTIDRSTLRQGFQIPVEFHSLLRDIPGGMPKQGETRNIQILIDGVAYNAQLKNQGFDRQKYADHPDLIQVRYNETSALAQRLRSIFSSTWEYVEHLKKLPENIHRKFVIRIPEERQESLVLNSTDLPNVFVIDYMTTSVKQSLSEEIAHMDELTFETFEPREDKHATIKTVNRMQKIRLIDRSIGNALKQLYDYRCQMTGDKIGEHYGVQVIEAHHIVPFIESMNNDTSNLIILSPNYHRIIHTAHPIWDNKQLSFHFPNGLTEKVKLNKHL